MSPEWDGTLALSQHGETGLSLVLTRAFGRNFAPKNEKTQPNFLFFPKLPKITRTVFATFVTWVIYTFPYYMEGLDRKGKHRG